MAAVLDLGEERPGRRLFDMFTGRVEVPSGIEITRVVPATIALVLEREGTPRMVPIVPDIEGEPAYGMIVGRIRTDPATVEVVGPETPLAELREAFTEPVSVAGGDTERRDGGDGRCCRPGVATGRASVLSRAGRDRTGRGRADTP